MQIAGERDLTKVPEMPIKRYFFLDDFLEIFYRRGRKRGSRMLKRKMNERQKRDASWMLRETHEKRAATAAAVTRAKKMGREGGRAERKKGSEGRKSRRGREDKDVNHNM